MQEPQNRELLLGWLKMESEALEFCITNRKENKITNKINSAVIEEHVATTGEQLLRRKLKDHKSGRGVELTGARQHIVIGKGYPDQ